MMKEQGKAQVAKKEQWKRKLLETAVSRAQDFVKSLVRIGEENPYEMILEKATPESTDWMEEYGLPVTDTDRQMMKFWFGLEKEKLQAMGNTVANAFLHGFISQSRDRRDRKRVRFFYQIGQEALAKEVVKALKEKGAQVAYSVAEAVNAEPDGWMPNNTLVFTEDGTISSIVRIWVP